MDKYQYELARAGRDQYPQPMITCQACTAQHCATVCPICKTPTLHFGVFTVSRDADQPPIFIPHFKTLEHGRAED